MTKVGYVAIYVVKCKIYNSFIYFIIRTTSEIF